MGALAFTQCTGLLASMAIYTPGCEPISVHSTRLESSCCVDVQTASGKYCVHLLADYITLAAAPTIIPPPALASASIRSSSFQAMETLTGLPAAALRQGALALYGACSPAEVTVWVWVVVCEGSN